MQNALVSIIICSYNNWPDLELAINSALFQSYRPLEVIVVDNASDDATSTEVPRRFGDRVRFVRQENRGASGAFNTGIRLAKGEFLQFMDGDDVLLPHKTEAQAAVFLERPDTDIVYGSIRRVQANAGQNTCLDAAVCGYDYVVAMF